ncbi:MAG: hypothetical protein MZV70_19755 [Desulfobacterales bacterium]|nr:hypothetical protein [Desulfobacterales bacterium]
MALAPAPHVTPRRRLAWSCLADTVRDITLVRGFVAQGFVSGDGGAAVGGASVLVRQIVGTSTNPRSWSQLTTTAGRYAPVLPPNLFRGRRHLRVRQRLCPLNHRR